MQYHSIDWLLSYSVSANLFDALSCLCDFDNFGVFLKINDRKAEEMSLREAIDTVRRSNRLDLLVLKDDHLPPSYSTHSLPASFRNKSRDRDLPNGYGDEREPELPSRCVE